MNLLSTICLKNGRLRRRHSPGHARLANGVRRTLSVPNKTDGCGRRLEFPVAVRDGLPEESARAPDSWVARMEGGPARTGTRG